ncbi:MAG: NUDIX hydrolase [Betaproteobacteria bacterium]|nr:NUDIX hydrolase [Betaproteobacteria bacterium]
MNYCSHCGAPVHLKIPAGDTLPRYVCEACHTVHYQNPKLIVGCIPVWQDRILLCRRAIEPRRGFWTLPAGFMENGETTGQAAKRETYEEARADVEIEAPFALFNLPHISQVYLMFRARMVRPDFAPGEESLDVSLFREAEIPWETIAFRTVRDTLERYFTDRAAGHYQFHFADVGPSDLNAAQAPSARAAPASGATP